MGIKSPGCFKEKIKVCFKAMGEDQPKWRQGEGKISYALAPDMD